MISNKQNELSFLLAVRIDSESRLQNLEIVIKYLKKYFDAPILVCESDTTANVSNEVK